MGAIFILFGPLIFITEAARAIITPISDVISDWVVFLG